jgi:hypothetical protein
VQQQGRALVQRRRLRPQLQADQMQHSAAHCLLPAAPCRGAPAAATPALQKRGVVCCVGALLRSGQRPFAFPPPTCTAPRRASPASRHVACATPSSADGLTMRPAPQK